MFKATSKTVLIALVTGLAACNDGNVAPQNQGANVSGGGALATLTQTDTVNFHFTITPDADRTIYIGAGNNLHIPAGSVCDPTSSYGTSEWDNACTPASHPIQIDASAWLDANNHPRIDFATHLRFVPSTNPANWVTISFTDTIAAQDSTADILYCATSYSQCVSELTGDATLITVKNTVTGKVTRRIKHFSGYLLSTGAPCEVSELNPDCVEGGEGSNRIGTGAKLSGPTTASASILTNSNSASAIIGPKGGVLSLASAGLTVVVPAGALSKITTLSVTTRAGKLLAYEFQPHGTQFAVPLRVTQDLRGTNLTAASLSALQAIYFADDSQVDDVKGLVTATEVLPVTLDGSRSQVSFEIRHFSGYIFATGEACGAGDTQPGCDGADANRIAGNGKSPLSGRLRTIERVGTAGARVSR